MAESVVTSTTSPELESIKSSGVRGKPREWGIETTNSILPHA